MVHTDSELLPQISSAEAWARGRLEVPGVSVDLADALTRLVQVLEDERIRSAQVFLSVVIRTQARRWEQLQDALLCLAAQTDQDFEVLLMLHTVDADQRDRVRALVDNYPAEFAGKVRLIDVQGGGRTRPLSVSLDHACGDYIAFYDDDDLLMADWVEAFHEGARRAPGQAIRANVATQLNLTEEWTDGSAGQRTIGVTKAEYAKRFNLVDHLQRNHTPFMGVAFPVAFFRFWGESFDEDLPVCEDWDVVVRAAGLVGMHSINELTAIYRQWEQAQTSYTRHDKQEWRAAEDRVRAKIDSLPFFAREGSIVDVLEVLEREHQMANALGEELNQVLHSTTWRAMAPVRALVERVQRRRR